MNYLSESEAIKIGECASYMESSTFLLYLDFRKFEDSLSEYKDKDQIIASSASRISQILGHLKFVRSEGDISVLVQTKNILYLYNNYPSSSMIKDLTICITEQNSYKTIMNRFKAIRKKKARYTADILEPSFFGKYEDFARVYASSSTITKLEIERRTPSTILPRRNNDSIAFTYLLNLCGFENFYIDICVDPNIVKPVVRLDYVYRNEDDITEWFSIYLETDLNNSLVDSKYFKCIFTIYNHIDLESVIKFSKSSIYKEDIIKEYIDSLIPELKNACQTLNEFDDKIKFIEACNKFGISIK